MKMTEPQSGLMSENVSSNQSTSQHELQHEWIVWYNEKPPRGVSQDDFEKSILNMGAFDTIEKFWQHFNNLKPEKLPAFSTLRLFKTGIKPCWEDPANYHGGKWVLNMDKDKTSDIWGRIVLAAVGHSLDCSDELCGIVLSIRADKDTLQIWNRTADPAVYHKITGELHHTLGLSPSEELLYQIHAGSMDFNANVRSRNSPNTKRRHSGENGNKKSSNHFSGNGFHSSHTSPSVTPSSPSRNNKNNRHSATKDNGLKSSDTDEEPRNTQKHSFADTNGHKDSSTEGTDRREKSGEKDDNDDGLFNDNGKKVLNKSWGDMDSDSEDGSDTEDIWGQGVDKKVDWGELAEEDDDAETTTPPAISPRSGSIRWGDEMELWEAENQESDPDGFVCVGRRRRADVSHNDKRSVSQDGFNRRPQTPTQEDGGYLKRTNSSEARDGHNSLNKQRGARRTKQNASSRSKGAFKEFARSDSVSPRGNKLLDPQKHKRSTSSSEQGDTPKGRRLSLSQEAGLLNTNNRRKNGSRPSSPAPMGAVKPPPGLKGKTWSPITHNPASSWAQVTQGKQISLSSALPSAKLDAPTSAPHSPHSLLPSPPASSTLVRTDSSDNIFLPQPIQSPPPPETTTITITTIATATSQTHGTFPPPSDVDSIYEQAKGPASSSAPTIPSCTPTEFALPPVTTVTPEIENKQPATPTPPSALHDHDLIIAQNAGNHEHQQRTEREDTKQPGLPSLCIVETPGSENDSAPLTVKGVTPRRKEKRKRKRNSLKKRKDKGNPDLRTHWLLLLSLIVLTCSVFCGIIVVHILDQRS